MLKCLWLSRTLPYPLNAGDRIYSARLAESLAARGVDITFVGLNGQAPPRPVHNIKWYLVAGSLRGQFASLLHTMPLVGARHATPKYEAEVRGLLQQEVWDIVAIDQYAMAWSLKYRRMLGSTACKWLFITHNAEEEVTKQQWQDCNGPLWERFYYLQNYLKTRRIERRGLRLCDLITVNTDTDAAHFRKTVPEAVTLTLTPGYDRARLHDREITIHTPRAAVIFGSFHWSAKLENLRLFLDSADARLHDAGIEMRIVGDIAADFRSELERRYISPRITGFVQDPAMHLNVRLAIVAEPIGGGFKHKLLDYIFNRVPIVALESCTAGLPASVRKYILTAPDIPSLMDCVETVIDDFTRLNWLQNGAFAAAGEAFDWSERGRALHEAILATR
jgi:hypothetical protein